MKSRLIDAAAFVIGAIAAFMQGGAMGDSPWPIRLALTILGPGYFVGFPLVFLVGAIGLASLGFFFLVSILVNGLIFGLTSYLIQKVHQEASGRPESPWPLAWASGSPGAPRYTISSWPWPEHVAPVDLSSPLAGRWKGVLHSRAR